MITNSPVVGMTKLSRRQESFFQGRDHVQDGLYSAGTILCMVSRCDWFPSRIDTSIASAGIWISYGSHLLKWDDFYKHRGSFAFPCFSETALWSFIFRNRTFGRFYWFSALSILLARFIGFRFYRFYLSKPTTLVRETNSRQLLVIGKTLLSWDDFAIPMTWEYLAIDNDQEFQKNYIFSTTYRAHTRTT